MLSHLQLSYSRVETSLQTLVDSIAAYNPSVSAAESLLAADAQVSQDLNLLVTHQRNALRLAGLRQTSASLDETIKSTIRLLAETRKDIKGIAPFIGAGEDAGSGSRGVDSQGHDNGDRMKTLPVKDVLDYAKFISKTSIPPTYRAPPPTTSSPENTTNRPSSSAAPPTPAAAAATTTNGLTTPTTALSSPSPTVPTTNNTALSALPSTTTSFLNPTAESLPFQPWPSQEVIASGALAELTRMVEAGQDPAEVKSKEEKEEEERLAREEEERDEERRREMARRLEGARDGGGYGGGAGGGGAVAFNPDDL
jgi:hypothetical protein